MVAVVYTSLVVFLFFSSVCREQDSEMVNMYYNIATDFYSNNALVKHKAGFHNETKDHTCLECGASFKSKPDLKRHMTRHNAPEIPCHLCNKLFNNSENYRKHLKRTHYKEREGGDVDNNDASVDNDADEEEMMNDEMV